MKVGVLVRAGVVLVVVYALLLALFPLLARPYAHVVSVVSDIAAGQPGWGGSIDAHVGDGASGLELKVVVRRAGSPEDGTFGISVRARMYLPLALLLALTFASPVPWKRRAISACWGIALLTAFSALGIWLGGVDALARWPQNPAGFSDGGKRFIHVLHLYANEVPMTAVLVPVILWAALTLRADDLALLVGRHAGAAGPGERPTGK